MYQKPFIYLIPVTHPLDVVHKLANITKTHVKQSQMKGTFAYMASEAFDDSRSDGDDDFVFFLLFFQYEKLVRF